MCNEWMQEVHLVPKFMYPHQKDYHSSITTSPNPTSSTREPISSFKASHKGWHHGKQSTFPSKGVPCHHRHHQSSLRASQFPSNSSNVNLEVYFHPKIISTIDNHLYNWKYPQVKRIHIRLQTLSNAKHRDQYANGYMSYHELLGSPQQI